jgi:taurine dioxygenase
MPASLLRAPDQAAFVFRRLTPAVGAVAEGADLAGLDDAAFASVEDALVAHGVLFFPGQALTPQQQRDLARRFGPLHIHPLYEQAQDAPEIIVLQYDETRKGANDRWHSDVSFVETPAKISVLFAEEIPPVGGDTLWLSAEAAYDALSPQMQAFLGGLRAVHSFARAFTPDRFASYGRADDAEGAYRRNAPVSHPVIRTHPVSGRRSIFVNESFTSHIEGLPARESDAILRFLLAHLAQPDFQLRWRWTANTVAIWDNRSTQHLAVSDYFPARRRVRRATVLDDARPV